MADSTISSGTIVALILVCILLLYFINSIISRVDSTSKSLDIKLLIFLTNLKIKLLNYINGLDKRQKEFFSMLMGWLLLNLVFLFSSNKDEYRNLFWPIDRGSSLLKDYGFMEFFIYSFIPFFTFILNNYINKEKKQ